MVLSPPLKKGDLGGFRALIKSPLPPLEKGDKAGHLKPFSFPFAPGSENGYQAQLVCKVFLSTAWNKTAKSPFPKGGFRGIMRALVIPPAPL